MVPATREETKLPGGGVGKGLRQTIETFQRWNVGQATTTVSSTRTTSAWLVADHLVGDLVELTRFGAMKN